MRPRTVRRFHLLVVFGWLLAAVLFGAGVAKADPQVDAYAARNAARVCAVLDDYPSEAGLLGVLQGIHEEGLSYFDAGQVVGLSVYGGTCPWHTKLLNRFVAKYASGPVYVAGHVGGALR